jgi:4-amino-4-deoxy-L-arabinose transferase-like glycosyltransferase
MPDLVGMPIRRQMQYRLRYARITDLHLDDTMKRHSRVTSSKRQAVGLFLLALGVRIAFVLTLEDRLYWPDEIDFDNVAVSLINGQGYLSDAFRGNPILPFFLAGSYKLFGHSYIVPRILQSFVGSLTVMVMFTLARRLHGRRVALLAGLGLALFPSLVYTSGVFYVDCLFTFLIALTVYLLSITPPSGEFRRLGLIGLCGIAFGITVLCRPIFLAYLPFAVLFIIFRYGENLRRRIAYALILAAMAILTIMPWTLRNYAMYDRLLLVSTGTGLFLWRGNNELTRGDTDDRYLDPGAGEVWLSRLQSLPLSEREKLSRKYEMVSRDLQGLDNIDKDRYLQKLAISFIVDNSARSMALFLHKIQTLYTPFTEVRPEHTNIFNDMQRFTFLLIFYPSLVLGVIGVIHGLSRWREHLPLYLAVLSMSVAYGVTTAAARFRIPIEPFLILYAAQGAVLVWAMIRTMQKRVEDLLLSHARKA